MDAAQQIKQVFVAHRQGLAHVLWLGGTPCSGKTSVAKLLAEQYAVQVYHYDRHERAHLARSSPEQHPFQVAESALTMDERWVLRPVEGMMQATLAAWRERFEMVVADLLALPRTPPVLAEGPGLLPGCVAPLLTSRRQAIWLVPTEAFKRATQPTRGGAPANQTSDHARAYDNLIALDLRLAAYVKERAVDLGLPVLDVDGTRSLAGTAVLVAEHFALAARATDRPDQ
jgi:hypothetical protein